nr:enoyl-CoA hydratase/isomerase family protein [Novosphingobium sp. BW1]
MSMPAFETILLERRERLLVLTLALNRLDAMNAVNLALHDELPEALAFASGDAGSDVVLLTGAGQAFSVGGDIEHVQHNANNPHLFDHEARQAKRIVQTMLDLAKPLVVRMNGHAVGLDATIALMGDIIVVAEHAKIGDPHVVIGLVAGDAGAHRADAGQRIPADDRTGRSVRGGAHRHDQPQRTGGRAGRGRGHLLPKAL